MEYDIRDRDSIGEISVNHPNHIVVTADMSSSTWNTVGTHEVFTVTGFVHMKIWFVSTETATSDGSARLGFDIEGDLSPNDFGGMLSKGSFQAGYFMQFINGPWNFLVRPYQGVTTETDFAVLDAYLYGQDVGYEIDTYAFSDGTLEFHCIWQPLTVGATVTAGSGGSL